MVDMHHELHDSEEDDDFFLQDLELDLMSHGLDDLHQVHWSQYHIDSLEHDAMSDLSTSFALETHGKSVKYSILNLHDNRLRDLQGLPSLPFVRECILSSNALTSCYLPELANQLPMLMEVDLSGNRLVSLKDLPFLPHVKVFSAAFNFLTSLEGIEHALPQVEEVDVRGNQLQRSCDLDPLTKLFQLRKLQIGRANSPAANSEPAGSSGAGGSSGRKPTHDEQPPIESSNPVCSRLSNILRLFENCESLQSIDQRSKSHFEDLFLRLNATIQTPQFDKLLHKYRSSGGLSNVSQQPSSAKKKAPSSHRDMSAAVVSDPLRTQQLSPSRSKVLFPSSQPSSAHRGMGMVSQRLQEGFANRSREQEDHSAFYESTDEDLPEQSEDVLEEQEVFEEQEEELKQREEDVAAATKQAEVDRKAEEHKLQTLYQMLVVTERSHFRSRLQDLSQAMYIWRSFAMLAKLHAEQQTSKAAAEKAVEETVSKTEFVDLQAKYEALQLEKQGMQQDLEKKLQQEKIKSDAYQKKYMLQETMWIEAKKQDAEERLKYQAELQQLRSTAQVQHSEVDHVLQEKQLQIDALTLEIQTFESTKTMQIELLRSKDLEMQELKQCMQALQEELLDAQKTHDDRLQQQEDSFFKKLADLEHHYQELLHTKDHEHQAAVQLERRQQEDIQEEKIRQMQRLESRLLKLQEAFETVSGNHEAMCREADGLRVQQDKDRQVIKELTKCVKKLQEVTDFKHQSLQDVDQLKGKVKQLEDKVSATQAERDLLRKQVADMLTHDQVKQQSTLMQLQQLESLQKDFDRSKQDLLTKLQVQEVQLTDAKAEAQQYKSRWQQIQQELLVAQKQFDSEMQRWQHQFQDSQDEVERLELTLQQKDAVQQRVKKVIQSFIMQQEGGNGVSSSVESLEDEQDEDWDKLLRSADEAMWRQARSKAKKQVQWRVDADEDEDEEDGNKQAGSEQKRERLGIADVSSSFSEQQSSTQSNTSITTTTSKTNTVVSESSGVCTSRMCQERIASLEQLLHEYQKALDMKQKECEHISESLNKVEEKSKDLGQLLQADKDKYEAAIEKYRGEKKKLTRLCKALEEDLLRKDAEVRLAQQKLNELQESLQTSFGLLHDANSPTKFGASFAVEQK